MDDKVTIKEAYAAMYAYLKVGGCLPADFEAAPRRASLWA